MKSERRLRDGARGVQGEDGLNGSVRLRALSPHGEQGQQVGSIDIAIEVDIAIRARRAPCSEENQQIGGIDIAIAIEVGGAVAHVLCVEFDDEDLPGVGGDRD